MKIKNILTGVVALLALSCADKKDLVGGSTYDQQVLFYNIKDGKKTLSSFSNINSLTVTRAQINTTQEFQFSAGLAKENSASGITLNVKTAPEEVEKYNSIYGTSFLVFPDSLLTSLTNTLSIEGGSVSSDIGKATIKISDSLANNTPYLLALKITPSGQNLSVLSGAQTIFYQVEKSVPVVSATLALTRDLYLRVDNSGSTVADIGTTFTMEGLLYVDQFRSATDVGEAQISSFMGTEGRSLMRFGDAGINGNQLQVNGRVIASFTSKQWYHIATVVAGTNTSVYVNGNLVVSYAASGSLGEFYIGRSYSDGRGIWGRVAELRLWNVARSAGEIKDNMFGVGTSAPGLYAYWKMNEVANNKIPDASGNNRNLTLWGQGTDRTQKTIRLFSEPAAVQIP